MNTLRITLYVSYGFVLDLLIVEIFRHDEIALEINFVIDWCRAEHFMKVKFRFTFSC